jgi:hypothetical protein
MNFLATFLLGVLTSAARWFFAVFTRKTAIVLALTAAIVAMMLGLSAFIKGQLATLAQYSQLIVPESFLTGLALLIPDNFEACIIIMFSAQLAVWAFNFNKELVKLYASGS